MYVGKTWHKVNQKEGRGRGAQDQGPADAVHAAAIDGSAEVDEEEDAHGPHDGDAHECRAIDFNGQQDEGQDRLHREGQRLRDPEHQVRAVTYSKHHNHRTMSEMDFSQPYTG